MNAARAKKLDLSDGHITRRAFLFTLPLILSSVLQVVYNAADLAVVGQFCGSAAVAAVGSTTSLFHVMTNLFLGLAVGVNIRAAFYAGAGDEKGASRVAHTAVLLALLAGGLMIAVGWFTVPLLLEAMKTSHEQGVFENAVLYLRICICGAPAVLLYNFLAGLLKAEGDTARPSYYLLGSGLLNLGFNVLFVAGFKMGVAGVAVATAIAQTAAAVCCLVQLARSRGMFRLQFSRLRFSGREVAKILALGVPAGVQTALFSVSNVLFQSAVNGMGSVDVVSGNAATNTLDGVVYAACVPFQDTAATFAAYNVGKGDLKNVKRSLFSTLLLGFCTGECLGLLLFAFARPLLHLFITDSEIAIAYGLERAVVNLTLYGLVGMMCAAGAAVRGMGRSLPPTLVALVGVCGVRILWIYTVFRRVPTLTGLYLSYPVTWVIAVVGYSILFAIYYQKLCRTRAV